jgi:peptide/nickel transport system permease protein
VHSGIFRFLIRRVVFAVALVLLVSSAGLILASLAPVDAGFAGDPAAIAEERRRAGLDRPIHEQYGHWLRRAVQLDLGESLRFKRPVSSLLGDAAINTALLGLTALVLATAIGIPLGVFTGSRADGLLASMARGTSLLLLSVPPFITSLVLLLIASRTGWLPAGGLAPAGPTALATFGLTLQHLALPSLALALPIAASLERVQSRAMREALADPSLLAALARGIPRRRVIWRHGLRLSLTPVLAIYGITVGTVLSGSFVVEIVMSWPGLGVLSWEALRSRDIFLVAGCAAAGSLCLAAGVLASDLALAAADPRIEEAA